MFRNRCRQKCIRHIGSRPVEHPVRGLLEGYAGTDDGVSGYGILNGQNTQGDPVRLLQGPGPAGPLPQEPVRHGALRNLDGNGPIGGLQPVDDNIAVGGGRMGREIPGGRDSDLPHARLVQVALADIGMFDHCFDIRERIDVICYIRAKRKNP